MPAYVQDVVTAGTPLGSLADAHTRVETLRSSATDCRAQATQGIPCGQNPVVLPSPSTTATTLADRLLDAAECRPHDGVDAMRTTVETITPRTRRGVELLLTVFAVGITLLAWVSVDLGVRETVPAQLLTIGGGLLALALAFHVVVRWRAAYADPLLLPIATLLNGFGLVMIHRLDLAGGRTGIDSDAGRQLVGLRFLSWSRPSSSSSLRDHRLLRRYTFTAMAVGLVLLLLPLLPGIGTTIYGSRIWID